MSQKAAECAVLLAKGEPLPEGDTVTIENGKYEVPYIGLEPISVDKNNMNAEGPNFTDVSGANYQLLKTSPLIDAGSNAAIGGLNLLDDILYGERIWGSTVDIGAFEFRIEK